LFAAANHVPFSYVILPAFLIVATGFISASFASLVNDYTDLEADRLGGKNTALMQIGPNQRKLALAISIIAAVLTYNLMRPFPTAQAVFAALCAIFAFYSLPPARLKGRGAFGVIAISLGEHVLPAVLAVVLVAESLSLAISPFLLVCLCGWSCAFGMRGIFWHQLTDIENDSKAGCLTLAVNVQAKTLENIARFVIFPLEIIFLVTVLVQVGEPAVWWALALYCVLDFCRYRFMAQNIIIVEAKPFARFVMFEYYQILLPLALLLAAIKDDTVAAFLAVAYIGLFIAPIALSALHVKILLQKLASPITGRD
jgi:4-hydroxybenzoate polyprenyltransferase